VGQDKIFGQKIAKVVIGTAIELACTSVHACFQRVVTGLPTGLPIWGSPITILQTFIMCIITRPITGTPKSGAVMDITGGGNLTPIVQEETSITYYVSGKIVRIKAR
jgi:hypothetical protein